MMKVNILGYGQMAKQIAALFYLGGYDVTIWNHNSVDEKDVYRQVKLINRTLGSNLTGTIKIIDSLLQLDDSLTIESVIEDITVKRVIYEKIKHKITKGYFTNSSSYSPSEIDETVGGLHFFNPITMNILEVYTPEGFANHTDIEHIFKYLVSSGFTIIPVLGNRGFIGNYILFHEISSALKLLEKYGYSVDSLSSLYEKLYNGRNIFMIIDLIGIDVVYKILQNFKENDDSIYLPIKLKQAIKQNILGKKNKTTIRSMYI